MTDTEPTSRRAKARGKAGSLKVVLLRDRWKLLILGSVLVVVIAFAGIEPSIPRRLRLFSMAVVAAAVIGYPWVVRIVDYLYRPAHTHLVQFNAEKDAIAIWKLPASSWRDLEVTEHEIYSLRAASPAWECREYDPEENEAVGTWRGSATDLELVESRAAINDIRNDLEEMAQEGLTIRVKQSSIVRDAVKDIATAFLRDYETETVYSGEELQKNIDEAIENWTLDEADDREQSAVDDTQDDQTQAEENVRKFLQVVNGEHTHPRQYDNNITNGNR